MKDLKKLYEGVIEKDVTVDDIKKEMRDGKEVEIKSQVVKKVPVKIIVQNPGRAQREEGEMFTSVESSRLISRGVLTQPALRQKLFGDLVKKAEDLQLQYTQLAPEKKDDDKKEEVKIDPEVQKKIDALSAEYADVLKELMSQEQNHSGLFDKTVEAIVNQKMDLYWTLNLTYTQEEGKDPQPLFPGKSLEEKLKVFDELEEKKEPFYLLAGGRGITIITLWRRGLASTQEDFDKQLKELEKVEG